MTMAKLPPMMKTGTSIVRDHAYERQIGPETELHELKAELAEMQAQYESVLMDTTKFPRAGSTNRRYFLPHMWFLMILEFWSLWIGLWKIGDF